MIIPIELETDVTFCPEGIFPGTLSSVKHLTDTGCSKSMEFLEFTFDVDLPSNSGKVVDVIKMVPFFSKNPNHLKKFLSKWLGKQFLQQGDGSIDTQALIGKRADLVISHRINEDPLIVVFPPTSLLDPITAAGQPPEIGTICENKQPLDDNTMQFTSKVAEAIWSKNVPWLLLAIEEIAAIAKAKGVQFKGEVLGIVQFRDLWTKAIDMANGRFGPYTITSSKEFGVIKYAIEKHS